MGLELNLRFPDKDHVIVILGDDDSGTLRFADPLKPKDHQDIRWYIETYGGRWTSEPDDPEAKRIKDQLRGWGKALFEAVFNDRAAERLFNRFQDQEEQKRFLTISALQPSILALPWELLHDPSMGGSFLFNENPPISIRRRVAGVGGGRSAFMPESKDTLHILFVVSRPKDVPFIDPMSDPEAVLDALEKEAPGRFTWEFLRPATIDALNDRLDDDTRTPVDILHFDGHGVFDRQGGIVERVRSGKLTLIQILSLVLKDHPDGKGGGSPANTGYLVFETAERKSDLLSAERLADNLNRRHIPLVILSACQGATMGQTDEPLGSVAARLTAAGIPAVLAMTHSVLVPTTHNLFGKFYAGLAHHQPIGVSLDRARRYLVNHPEKRRVRRGEDLVCLKLDDWFVPALYQSGDDIPLLQPAEQLTTVPEVTKPCHNIKSRPEAGFFGRRRELWEIEKWFADQAQRITITGFGGQGKTALAQEAGRWLTRTGMFKAAVFVDYSRFQGLDAVAMAVAEIGALLEESLIDAQAAEKALEDTPTLVILDNLEALTEEPLRQLLDAAVAWSEAGESRVLCTTRIPDFEHQDYRVEGTNIHRPINLEGLGRRVAPDDALAWFAELMKLPPKPIVPPPSRDDLIDLFEKVRFHPLSILVLAAQLKTRRPGDLGKRLDDILAASPPCGVGERGAEDEAGYILPELAASLRLSLDKLDEAARQVLPRLGVFQGGAMEEDLLVVTGLGVSGERKRAEALLTAIEQGNERQILKAIGQDLPEGKEIPAELKARLEGDKLNKLADQLKEYLAKTPVSEADIWPKLRAQLEAAALIEVEDMKNIGVDVPFLKFHPTLAPMLWAQLKAEEKPGLSQAHKQRYKDLASYLYKEDLKNPRQARAIAQRELPNLHQAVNAALEAGDPEAVDFADNVNLFLGFFGLKQESEALVARAQAMAGEIGSRAWYLAQFNRGEQLFREGRVTEATEVFRILLDGLGDAPSYNRALTLHYLGRCLRVRGHADQATVCLREVQIVLDQLEQTESVKRERGVCSAELADSLLEQGQYAEARQAYEDGLKAAKESNDMRQQGAILGNLGTLEMLEGKLDEAADRIQAALSLFQQLGEPESEAALCHQLGIVFQKKGLWDESERRYREAARIKERQNMIAGVNGAVTTWNQLALLSRAAGKLEAAEMWYQKAIEGCKASGDKRNLALSKSNLADLLQSVPGRLAEARELAKEALGIKQTVDPSAAEIWKVYTILAEIADQEAEETTDNIHKADFQAQAVEYRRLAREARRAFAGTRQELKKHAELIQATVAACTGDRDAGKLVARHQAAMLEGGGHWAKLAETIDRLLAGERDPDFLCQDLDSEDSMIIEAILAGIADPSTVQDLMPDEDQAQEQPTKQQEQVQKKLTELVVVTAAASLGNEQARKVVAKHQEAMRQTGGSWPKMADTIDRLLAGEREMKNLTEGLDPDQSRLIQAILDGIADPSKLQAMMPETEKIQKQLTELVLATVAACQGNEEARELVAKHQAGMRDSGGPWTKLADTIDRILAGERDQRALCVDLAPDFIQVIQAILEFLADPSKLQELLAQQNQSED